MKKIKITVMKKVWHEDLSKQFENPIEHTCDMEVGQTFIVENCLKPESLCQSAWESMYPFVKALSEGEKDFFDGWMKSPYSAMISCNDGFRPVSFYIEVIE